MIPFFLARNPHTLQKPFGQQRRQLAAVTSIRLYPIAVLLENKARRLKRLREEIGKAKERFGLGAGARILSCYEAGRDGFWLHRCLLSWGAENLVVDSSSIEVNRRKRRAKSDRIDAGKLLTMLMRYHGGEKKL